MAWEGSAHCVSTEGLRGAGYRCRCELRVMLFVQCVEVGKANGLGLIMRCIAF